MEFSHKWKEITFDKTILKLIEGIQLEFESIPKQEQFITSYKFDKHIYELMTNEIKNLNKHGIIEKCEHSAGEIISPIFSRPKKSGKIRIIGNFKDINKCIKYHKFKMDTLKDVLDLVKPNMYMTSIDLKDAYFTVPLSPESRKYVRFSWEGDVLEFICMMFGLGPTPRIFTKLMKIPISTFLFSSDVFI